MLVPTVLTSSLWAIGIGVYGTGGLSIDYMTLGNADNNNRITTHDYYYGGGFILDTVVARDQVFSYHFKLEYNQFNIQELKTNILLKRYNYIGMYHTFGFGVIRSESIRFWMGPQIGLSYTFGKRKIRSLAVSFNFITGSLKLTAVGFDALLAMGTNFNIGDESTLFIDLGAGYMGKYNTNDSLSGHAIGFKGSAGVMFRIDDNYKKI
jgi:hypothetical protein